MELSSPEFTNAHVDAFLLECRAQEQRALADRLEAASQRLIGLVERMPAARASGSAGWSVHEVLAHIASLSKYYGVLAYRIGSGTTTDVNLLTDVRLRDPIAQRFVARTREELQAAARADHQRTIAWLRTVEPSALQRRASVGAGRTLSAEDVLRLGLCSHLELHLDQLERELA